MHTHTRILLMRERLSGLVIEKQKRKYLVSHHVTHPELVNRSIKIVFSVLFYLKSKYLFVWAFRMAHRNLNS